MEAKLIERFDGGDKMFDAFEVSKQQCKMVLAVSFFDFEELNFRQPLRWNPLSLSASYPFNEEMEMVYECLVNRLNPIPAPVPRSRFRPHDALQLKAHCQKIGTKQVFPFHTENAELYKKFMSKIVRQATIVEKNQEYQQ